MLRLHKNVFYGIIITVCFSLMTGCGGSKTGESETTAPPAEEETSAAPSDAGVGPAAEMELAVEPVDPGKVSKGKGIYEVKCAACHSLGENRVVGPGWKGVTKRRKPQWIVNMVTNTEEMLAKDPEAQKQMELCMVRMPNQNLNMDDAKSILDFMRKQDGE